MKILRIKLTNLNSLRGTHTVDFEAAPLAGVGLFAITGPTGAGKSTLLDAITLALYGRAARYGSAPSPEDMMSRHCGECSAEVVFRVPSGTYRAEWQLKRARGRADGKVQPAKSYVYDSAEQPLTRTPTEAARKIEELVGLDYPRFLRSTLRAQGEFAQFLKAKPDDRAELLESLTGTGIYSELGALAHSETTRRENELKAKEEGLRQIQLLPDESRQKLVADIPLADAAWQQVKVELQRASEQLNQAANLTAAFQQEQQAVTGQTVLAGERQVAASDLVRLARHRLTIPFHGDIVRLADAGKACQSAEQLFELAQGDHARVLKKAARCLRGFDRLLATETAVATATIDRCEMRKRVAGERMAAAAKLLQENRADQNLHDQLADFGASLASLQGARKNLQTQWTALRKLAGQLDPQAEEALAPTAEELTLKAGQTILNHLDELKTKHEAVASAAKRRADDELAHRADHLAKARLVASLDEHRAGLKPGEPCPLCGAAEHPFADGVPPAFPFAELEQRVTEAKAVARKSEQEVARFVQLQAELEQFGRGLPKAIAECGGLVANLTKEFSWLGLTVPETGKEDETRATLQQRAQAYRGLKTQAEEAEREVTAAEGERKQAESLVINLKEREATLARESPPEAEEPDQPLPEWSSCAEAERDWSATKLELSSVSTTHGLRQQERTRHSAAMDELLASVASRLAGSDFAGIAELQAARLEQSEAERIEAKENRFIERAHRLAGELDAARQMIAKLRLEAVPEGEAAVALKATHITLQERHNDLIRDLTTWRNLISQDDQHRQVAADRQREAAVDRGRLAVWQRLRGLIGSFDGRLFRRYAQCISLDVLVHFANGHLLRLSDRYRMRRRTGEELELEIEDLHQAGAVRPMASLSGGESFLASLALALGLSDIAGRNVRIESLFVDEGFGSLDSDTLDLAISTLETLRQENKTVGVISHVDFLKERIATQIVVEKQSGGISGIRMFS